MLLFSYYINKMDDMFAMDDFPNGGKDTIILVGTFFITIFLFLL